MKIHIRVHLRKSAVIFFPCHKSETHSSLFMKAEKNRLEIIKIRVNL